MPRRVASGPRRRVTKVCAGSVSSMTFSSVCVFFSAGWPSGLGSEMKRSEGSDSASAGVERDSARSNVEIVGVYDDVYRDDSVTDGRAV